MLLPVLKPADWSGLEAEVLAHRWVGPVDDPQVVVAYAHHTETSRDYVRPPGDPAAEDELVQEAFTNLHSQGTSFEIIEADDNRLAMSIGHPMAAERALLQDHMLLAHEKLEAEELVVAVPRSGLLLVVDRHGGHPARRTLLKAHSRALSVVRPETAIFSGLVVMTEGRPTSTLRLSERWD